VSGSEPLLPVVRADALPVQPEEHRWLVEGLWAAEAVGIVGGEPKCGKSFLALDLAVSVASGTPCLGRYGVARSGRVLLFPAEDALHVVRERLCGICRARGLELARLDLHVITAPVVRLDSQADARRLDATVAHLSPALVVLDPFVRLHRVDENASGDVAPLLAHLRQLQRRHHAAVVVVHHARKGAAGARDGQALRGSSEFHAWGDSNLYLRRRGDALVLAVEHRAAPGCTGIPLRLAAEGGALSLQIVQSAPAPAEPQAASPAQAVERALAAATQPLPLDELRRACRIRTATLCATLADLVRDGRVVKTHAGYRFPVSASRTP